MNRSSGSIKTATLFAFGLFGEPNLFLKKEISEATGPAAVFLLFFFMAISILSQPKSPQLLPLLLTLLSFILHCDVWGFQKINLGCQREKQLPLVCWGVEEDQQGDDGHWNDDDDRADRDGEEEEENRGLVHIL